MPIFGKQFDLVRLPITDDMTDLEKKFNACLDFGEN